MRFALTPFDSSRPLPEGEVLRRGAAHLKMTELRMIDAFLQNLFDQGNVCVGHPDAQIEDEQWSRVSVLLSEFELVHRSELPGEPPTFAIPTALWATRSLYRACQAVVYRDLPEELLSAFLGESCPAPEDPSRHYSVDLLFQFLPDVMKMASHISSSDPLLEILHGWANQFPLSSVGIMNVTPRSLNAVLNHPVLLRYYVDRVIARRDTTRLSDSIVQQTVQRAIGFHRHLFPELGPTEK